MAMSGLAVLAAAAPRVAHAEAEPAPGAHETAASAPDPTPPSPETSASPSGDPPAASSAAIGGTATATDGPPAAEAPLRNGLRWHVGAAWRVSADHTSRVDVLSPTPAAVISEDLARNRFRFGGQLEYAQDKGFVRGLMAEAEADFRQSSQVVDNPDGFLLRKAFAEATTLAGRLGAGRTTSTWGLGLVAQDGVDDNMQFGMKHGGSLVNRVQYAILPAALFQKGDPLGAFPLAIAVAYDRVVWDDMARTDTDVAHNWILAALYRGKELQAGLYGVKRDQTDASNLGLDALIADAFVRYGVWTKSGWNLAVSGEFALVSGTTTWLRSVTQPDKLDVAQYGGVLRAEAAWRGTRLRLEGGIASGDDRPLDGTLRNFQFATDYHVGLVLFSQYMRLQSRNTMANLGDPRYTNGAPAGAERIDTHGAVTQALYLHPVVRVEATPRLALMAGAVLARSPGEVADPYQSYLAGGVPTGPRGAKRQTSLGLEFDTAVEWNQPIGSGFSLLARGDAGVLLPGAAYDSADGTPAPAVAAVQGQIALRGKW